MLTFKATIDKNTCSVCKERDGKEAFYDWLTNELRGKDALPCEKGKFYCRCILEEDCRPYSYTEKLDV